MGTVSRTVPRVVQDAMAMTTHGPILNATRYSNRAATLRVIVAFVCRAKRIRMAVATQTRVRAATL